MKSYSKAASHKGKTAYRTPSRWLSGRPEAFKQTPGTKINNGRYFPPKADQPWAGKKIGKAF